MTVTTHRTFCRFCHAACPMEVDVEDNVIVGVRGDGNDPIFGGYTCIKGRHLADQHHHPDRLRTALRRRPDGGFDEIPTAQAFDEIADRLRPILADNDPRAVATYAGTATFQNAAAHPVGRAFHAAIGSPSFYTSITIDQPAKLVTPLRLGTWSAGVQPWNTADVSLVVGINIVVSMLGIPGGPTFVNPLAALRDARKRGLKLIVIDPRRTETAVMADIHLQVKPGEDPTLLAGMLRVILDEDLIDHEFCDRWVDGLDELHRSLRAFDLDHVAERTGVPADDIVEAARTFAAASRGMATCGTGPNMAPHGTLMEHLAACFNVVCGRFPREGEQVQNPTGVLGLTGPASTPKAQVKRPRPEYLSNGPKARMRGLTSILGQPPTAALADEILEPGDGQVKALFTVGGNPVLAWPDQAKVVRALESLELHVALDIRLSATARLADYVIPSALSLERPDVPTNVDRWFEVPYVMYSPAVIEPDDTMVDEAGFYVEIARRLGLTLELPGGELTPDMRPTGDDLLELGYPFVRVPWAELRETDGAEIRPELTMTVQPADPDCTDRFAVAPDGLGEELRSIRAERDPYGELRGYDPEVHTHRLTSRRLKGVFNSSGREIEALRAKEGTSYAHAHPSDLERWGVTDGDLVDISSPRSTVRTVVKAAPDVRPGSVSMAHSWGDLPGETGPVADPRVLGDTTGRLSDNASLYDPITGLPVMSAIPVKVTPVSPGA
jgi:anaerobic selenocysteine-containing dehydrogenase